MNPKKPIAYNEASQTFSCDQYYANNFVAFLEANAVRVDKPRDIGTAASAIGGEQVALKLPGGSPRLDQELGDALIVRFLATDQEIKQQQR